MLLFRVEIVVESLGGLLHFDAERSKAENATRIFVSQCSTSIAPTVFQLPERVIGHVVEAIGANDIGHVLPGLLSSIVSHIGVGAISLDQNVKDFLMAKLASQMEGSVTSMRPEVDIDRVISSQHFDQVEIAMFRRPMESRVSGRKVFGLGQSWVIPKHLGQDMVVTFGSCNHPLFDGLIEGVERG